MKVKLYKTENCPWCVKVLGYLEKKGAEIEIVNCTNNEENRKELIEVSRQTSVPVSVINGKVIIGFDRKAIDEALVNSNTCDSNGCCE